MGTACSCQEKDANEANTQLEVQQRPQPEVTSYTFQPGNISTITDFFI